MLQISRRADYAVRIMLELGDQATGERVTASQLALRTDVPKSFLHKIIADLVKSGLVRTYKGPSGGLALGRSAESINVQQIIEAVDGPVCLNECLLRPQECPRDVACPAHSFWGRLQASVLQQMQAATLDALVAEGHELGHHPRQQAISYVFSRDEREQGN